MENKYAITEYPDVKEVTKKLDRLITLPLYSINKKSTANFVRVTQQIVIN